MAKPGQPRIILFDLETLPNLDEAMEVWCQLGTWPGKTLKATVNTIVCAGWKELGSKKTQCISAWDYSRWDKDVNDDYSVCRAIYNKLKDADAVVTHNGKKFDWKFLQTRLLKHGLPVLSKIPHIDTCELASRNIYSFNNRLGYLGEQFVNDKKMPHEGWKLWVKVRKRNKKAMKEMTEYCKQDVVLLEKIYELLRPFASNIPNHNLWIDPTDPEQPAKVCPSCGEDALRLWGWRHVKTKSYRRIRCHKCGSYGRLDARDRNPRSL